MTNVNAINNFVMLRSELARVPKHADPRRNAQIGLIPREFQIGRRAHLLEARHRALEFERAVA